MVGGVVQPPGSKWPGQSAVYPSRAGHGRQLGSGEILRPQYSTPWWHSYQHWELFVINCSMRELVPISGNECTTFAPVTIAPMINANVKRNPPTQGIIFLVSHRNLLCISYMIAIQDVFCVAVFLHRSVQNLVWNICLLTEFANQIWRGKLFPATLNPNLIHYPTSNQKPNRYPHSNYLLSEITS